MIFVGTKLLPDKEITIKGEGRKAQHNKKNMTIVGLIFVAVVIGMGINIIPLMLLV